MTILVPNPFVRSLYPDPEFATVTIAEPVELDLCTRCQCYVADRTEHVAYHRQTISVLLDLQQRIESLETERGARAQLIQLGGQNGHRS